MFLRKASHDEPFGDAVTREVREQIDFQEDQGDVHLHIRLLGEKSAIIRRLGEKSATLALDGFNEDFLSYFEDPLDPEHLLHLVPALSVHGVRLAADGVILREVGVPQAYRHIRLVYRSTFPRRAGLALLADNMRQVLPNTVRPLH